MNRRNQSGRTAPSALAVRAAWGTALIVAPGPLLRLMGGIDEGRTPRRLMGALGARHLLQAALEQRSGRRMRQIGIGVDLVHAATDIVFAGLDRPWARAALSDAAITTGFAAIGILNP